MTIESENKPEYRFTFVRIANRVQKVFGEEIDRVEFFIERWYPNQPECPPHRMEIFTGKQIRMMLAFKSKIFTQNKV